MLGRRESPAGDRSTDRIDTLIGKETEIKGMITGTGTLRLEGRLEGEINNRGDVIVGEGASLVANIRARNVTIAGRVKGNVDAEGRLELVPSGRLEGDIKVATLVIGEGAVFRGSSDTRSAEPEGQPQKAAPAVR